MRRGFLDSRPKAKKPATGQPTPAPSQGTPAGSTLISDPPIKRNKLPSTVPFPTKPTHSHERFWSFLSADPSQPEPNASCALFMTPRSLKIVQDLDPWIGSGGQMSGQGPPGPKGYEIKRVKGRGLGVFATRDFAEDALVIEEQPVLVWTPNVLADAHGEAIVQHALSHLTPDIQKSIMDLSIAPPYKNDTPLLGRLRTNSFGPCDTSLISGDSDNSSLYLTMSRYALSSDDSGLTWSLRAEGLINVTG